MSLKKLSYIGFKKVGFWSLENNKLLPNLSEEQNSSNILYCFVIDEVPMYIGKTTQMLKKRMYGYQNPSKTQHTNIRNNQKIKSALESSAQIDIYVLPDHGLLHFGSFHLNLAAGLEDSITNTIKPSWNIQGK